jgi:hypothetical protein
MLLGAARAHLDMSPAFLMRGKAVGRACCALEEACDSQETSLYIHTQIFRYIDIDIKHTCILMYNAGGALEVGRDS